MRSERPADSDRLRQLRGGWPSLYLVEACQFLPPEIERSREHPPKGRRLLVVVRPLRRAVRWKQLRRFASSCEDFPGCNKRKYCLPDGTGSRPQTASCHVIHNGTVSRLHLHFAKPASLRQADSHSLQVLRADDIYFGGYPVARLRRCRLVAGDQSAVIFSAKRKTRPRFRHSLRQEGSELNPETARKFFRVRQKSLSLG